MARYFAFTIEDAMFPSDVVVVRRSLTVSHARSILAKGVVFCLNDSHRAIVDAMKKRGINVEIPTHPPLITLTHGDEVVTMSVRGLPVMTEKHHHTLEEISQAKFVFGLWEVLPVIKFRVFDAVGFIHGGGRFITSRMITDYKRARCYAEAWKSGHSGREIGVEVIEKK